MFQPNPKIFNSTDTTFVLRIFIISTLSNDLEWRSVAGIISSKSDYMVLYSTKYEFILRRFIRITFRLCKRASFSPWVRFSLGGCLSTAKRETALRHRKVVRQVCMTGGREMYKKPLETATNHHHQQQPTPRRVPLPLPASDKKSAGPLTWASVPTHRLHCNIQPTCRLR